jgi:hypothetical protein
MKEARPEEIEAGFSVIVVFFRRCDSEVSTGLMSISMSQIRCREKDDMTCPRQWSERADRVSFEWNGGFFVCFRRCDSEVFTSPLLLSTSQIRCGEHGDITCPRQWSEREDRVNCSCFVFFSFLSQVVPEPMNFSWRLKWVILDVGNTVLWLVCMNNLRTRTWSNS